MPPPMPPQVMVGPRSATRRGRRARGRRAASAGVSTSAVGHGLVGLGVEDGRLGQHLGIERRGLEQLGVGAVGHDLVLVQQHDPVGQGDGREPVGDDQVVRPSMATRKLAWMRCSTWTSMALVASSRTSIGGLTTRARAMAIR